jgi:hypothetical protein
MQIKRSPEREEYLFKTIINSFFERDKDRAESIHLSDLLYPRQAYWRRKHPLPATRSEVQYWVIGRGHEDVFHHVTGLKHIEVREWEGIVYSIDFFLDNPNEMKTRRGYLAKDGEEPERYESYLHQLRGYCACEYKQKGELWVWSLLEKVDAYKSAPVLACYDVLFTEEELEEERKSLLTRKNGLQSALDYIFDPFIEDVPSMPWMALPACPGWMCIDTLTTMIKKPYCKTCNREFEGEWGINKHLDSKTGKGHETEGAVFEKTVVPKCKYYPMCLGGESWPEKSV